MFLSYNGQGESGWRTPAPALSILGLSAYDYASFTRPSRLSGALPLPYFIKRPGPHSPIFTLRVISLRSKSSITVAPRLSGRSLE
jgi:hypothetical protein